MQENQTLLHANNKGADQPALPCYSISRKYDTIDSFMRCFNILTSPCSEVGWFESYFARNHRDRFSHV